MIFAVQTSSLTVGTISAVIAVSGGLIGTVIGVRMAAKLTVRNEQALEGIRADRQRVEDEREQLRRSLDKLGERQGLVEQRLAGIEAIMKFVHFPETKS